MVRKNLNEIRDSGINLFIGINLNFFFFFQMYQRVIYISEIVYLSLLLLIICFFFQTNEDWRLNGLLYDASNRLLLLYHKCCVRLWIRIRNLSDWLFFLLTELEMLRRRKRMTSALIEIGKREYRRRRVTWRCQLSKPTNSAMDVFFSFH